MDADDYRAKGRAETKLLLVIFVSLIVAAWTLLSDKSGPTVREDDGNTSIQDGALSSPNRGEFSAPGPRADDDPIGAVVDEAVRSIRNEADEAIRSIRNVSEGSSRSVMNISERAERSVKNSAENAVRSVLNLSINTDKSINGPARAAVDSIGYALDRAESDIRKAAIQYR